MTETLTDEVARAIIDVLGGPDASLSERVTFAEKLIADQQMDIESLKNKMTLLKTIETEQGERFQQLTFVMPILEV